MCLDHKNIAITNTLAYALAAIRSPTETLSLWADQLCINQYDLVEKQRQVKQMLDIYATAERVHLWLGTHTDESVFGMMALNYFCHSRSAGCPPPWDSYPPRAIRAGMNDIMTRPWFKRFWVVQEAAVAREVVMQCGQFKLSWLNKRDKVLGFTRAIKAAAISPEWKSAGMNDVDMDLLLNLLQRQLENGPEKDLYSRTRQPPDLLDISYEMRHRQAGDPRDRIIALLGLVDEQTRRQLAPDYSMTVGQTHRRFEEALLTKNPLMVENPVTDGNALT